jgi:hypothetical protein
MVESLAPLLAPEDLATQLSTIEVLLSIYNGSTNLEGDERGGVGEEEDVILTSESYTAIRNLAQFLALPIESLGQSKSIELRDGMPQNIQLGFKIDPLRGTLDEEESKSSTQNQSRSFILDVAFPVRRLHQTKKGSEDEVVKPSWNLKHADWLDRPSYDALCLVAKQVKWEVDESVGYVMNVIEAISEASLEFIAASKDSQGTKESNAPNANLSTTSSIVLRSWHLLISLSMKDKRKDLVTYATRHDLTGFVLAGKPGLVVLECSIDGSVAEAVRRIDSFWSDIKTTSWSDLPPPSKKVTERHREENVERCFKDMQDVTSIEQLGGLEVEEGGRVRRNDLDKVKLWLKEQGCIGQLDIVLGKES